MKSFAGFGAKIEDVGIRRKVLLGKKGESWESGRNSCGVRMDVEPRASPEELCPALLVSRLEFPRLSLPIPQHVSFFIRFSQAFDLLNLKLGFLLTSTW